ncbi:MAG: hypothetical protein ABI772_05490 [Bacteroidota bacterium]
MATVTKHRISKSTYIRSLQCLKSLYLYKYFYKDRDPLPEERRMRFQAGHSVGKKAWSLFPGGVDLSPAHVSKYPEMIRYTADLVAKQTPVLYEAAFIYDEVLAALDILVYNNGWHAYEVKSSVQISDTYLEDAALQHFIITSGGLELTDFSIIHLKKNHKEITGEESNDDLFQITSLLQECRDKTAFVKEKIAAVKKTLASPGIPKVDMSEHCTKPYDCDFQGFCKRQKALLTAGQFKTLDM